MTANGGFFFTNLLSFFHPYALTLTTPTEILPYGWTTTDLWCAPLVTGLYALLTHAQPFWAELHALLVAFGAAPAFSSGIDRVEVTTDGGSAKLVVAEALNAETARAACAVFLTTLFVTRTVRNMGADYLRELRGGGAEKKRVMRSSE